MRHYTMIISAKDGTLGTKAGVISSIPEPTRSTIYHHWVLPHIPTGGYYNVTLTCGYHNVTLTCAKLIGNEHRHCSQKGRKKID